MATVPLTSDMAVVAILGFSIWEVHKAYNGAVPSMQTLRETAPDSSDAHRNLQHLVDADITVGGVALFAGLAAAYMMRSLFPLILISGTYAILAYYHHSVLAAPRP